MLGHLNIADVVARLHLCFGLTPRILVFLTITGNKSWESWLRSSRSTHPSCSPSKITLWTEPIKHGLKSSKQVILWMEPIKHALPLEKWPLKIHFNMASYSDKKKQEILNDYENVLDKHKLREVPVYERRNLLFTKVQNLGAERLKELRKDMTTVMLWVRHSLSRSPCLFLMHTHIYSYTIHM